MFLPKPPTILILTLHFMEEADDKPSLGVVLPKSNDSSEIYKYFYFQ